MKISVNDLQYILFPISNLGTDENSRAIANEVYKTWKLVWSKAFLELDGNEKLFSDGFSRQTKIGALFYKDICVSLATFRETDFSHAFQREDSLLEAWDEEAFTRLLIDGPKVTVCSYLSVHPDFRGEIAPSMTLKLLISLMSIRAFLQSNSNVMTGTMRCDRGTNKAAKAVGATPLKKSSMHGGEVELVAFYKNHIIENFDQYTHLWSEQLWQQRIDLTKETMPKVSKAS